MLKRKSHKRKSGLAPGSVVFTGEVKLGEVLRHNYRYNEVTLEKDLKDVPTAVPDLVTWFDVRGLHDEVFIKNLGEKLHLHPLIQEDMVDVLQRPKFDEYHNTIYITLKALTFDTNKMELGTEHVSIVLLPDMVVTAQEDETDLFGGVRQRLDASFGRIRMRPADYLAYALMDEITDNYFHVIESVQHVVDELEEQVFRGPSEEIRNLIHQINKEVVTIKRLILPTRDLVVKFIRSEHELLSESTQIFARDLLDHLNHLVEQIDSIKEHVVSLQNVYLTEVSNKLNNVMKVLTIVSVVFIPLTFVAGVYGMNFDHIPELRWEYGYLYFWSLIVIISVILLIIFRRIRWL